MGTRLVVNGVYIERWRTSCEDGLAGRDITISGLSSTRADVLARVVRADRSSQTVRLTPSAPAFTVTAASSRLQLAVTCLMLGVEDILRGIDTAAA